MVEIGTLSVVGEYQGENLDIALNRVSSNMQDVEQQSNQTNASLSRGSAIAGTLGTALIGLGVAGIGAMTALATKSPVLAGTMAKIEVETLKLSNTVGRQLKPVFDEVAGSLLPAINQAFVDNQDTIGGVVDKTVLLVQAFSDLIGLDLEGFFNKVDEGFSKNLGANEEKQMNAKQKYGAFSESVLGLQETTENIKQGLLGAFDPTDNVGFFEGISNASASMSLGFLRALPQGIVDLVQFILDTDDAKNQTLTTSTGVGRG